MTSKRWKSLACREEAGHWSGMQSTGDYSGQQQFAPSVTLLDIHLSIEAHSKEIEKLKEEIKFQDRQKYKSYHYR